MYNSQEYLENVFPPQRVSDAQKTPAWYKACVRNIANDQSLNDEGRLDFEEMRRNRNILGHKLDMRELAATIDPRNTGIKYHQAPARLRKHNLILPRVADIQSQGNRRYFKPHAKPLAGGAFERVKDAVNAAAMEYANYQVLVKLQQQGVPVQLPEQAPPSPPEAAQQILQNYKDVSEIDGNKLLRILQDTYKTAGVFMDAWGASCSTGEIAFMVDEHRGVPVFRAIDSEKLRCELSSNQRQLHGAAKQRYEEWLTLPEIIDEFGDDMTAREIADLEREGSPGLHSSEMLRMGFPDAGDPREGGTHAIPHHVGESPLMGRPVMPGPYDVQENFYDVGAQQPYIGTGKLHGTMGPVRASDNLPMATGTYTPDPNNCDAQEEQRLGWYLYRLNVNGNRGLQGGRHRVVRTWWRSLRSYLMLYWVDPTTGRIQKSVVPKNYKLTEQDRAAGAIIRQEWITEGCQGTMIGEKLFKRMRPMPWQNGKLGIVGVVMRGIGQEPMPVVSVLRPLMLQWIGLFYQIDKEVNKAQGKKIVVFVDDLPSFDKDNPERNLDLFQDKLQNDDIIYLQRHKLGGMVYGQANTNGIPVESIDLTASNLITQILVVLDRLERVMAMVSGVPNERMAQIAPSMPAESVDMSMSQASFMLEPALLLKDEAQVDVLECLLHCGISCFDNDTWAQLVLSDQTREWTMIDRANLSDTLLGVAVLTEPKNAQLLERFKESMIRRYENGATDVLTVVQGLTTDSLPEMARILAAAEQQLQAANAQAQQQKAAYDEQVRQDNLELGWGKIEAGLQEALITAGVAMSAKSEEGITPFQQAQLDLKASEMERKGQENQQRISLESEKQAGTSKERATNLLKDVAKLTEQNRARLQAQAQADREAEQIDREQDQQDKQHADHVRLEEKHLKIEEKKANKPAASSSN